MQNKERFIVTARKWRPQRFDALVGQEALAQALKHALQTGKTAHAYLFSGIRGVGKTSTARLLAKALNCLALENGEPCNCCSNCLSINEGSAIDVLEIDGASNRGIDAIRDLRETVNYLPVKLRYKVYIIDEVHMLTQEASNALLKTLEEPPSHVVFILATTEVHKLLPTIRSRCQHYVFKKIPVAKIVTQLTRICETEGYRYEKEALSLIAEAGDGSLRDAESIFDQVVIYTEGNLTLSSVQEVLGISPERFYELLWQGIIERDVIAVFRAIDEYLQHFGDVRSFVWGMVLFLKRGLLVKRLALDDELVDMTTETYEKFASLFAPVTPEEIVRMMQIMGEFLRGLRYDQYDRLAAELLFIQLTDYKNLIPLAEIRDELLKCFPPQGVSVSSGMKEKEPKRGISPDIKSSFSLSSFSQPSFSGKDSVVVKEDKSISQNGGGIEISSGEKREISDPEKAFFAFLQSSSMTKHMAKDICGVEWEGTLLTIKTKARYVADYLSKASAKIVDFVTKQCKHPIKIQVYLDDGTSSHEKKTTQQGRDSIREASQDTVLSSSKEEISQESFFSESNAKDDDMVRYVEKLFNAKKYL